MAKRSSFGHAATSCFNPMRMPITTPFVVAAQQCGVSPATGQWSQAAATLAAARRRCLWISRAPSSVTGQSCSATCQALQLRLQQVLPNGGYLGAAAVKEEMRALAPPQVEGAKGDEFCMEGLYRMLLQADDSPEAYATHISQQGVRLPKDARCLYRRRQLRQRDVTAAK